MSVMVRRLWCLAVLALLVACGSDSTTSVYELSAKDGSEINLVGIPVTL